MTLDKILIHFPDKDDEFDKNEIDLSTEPFVIKFADFGEANRH